MTIKIHCKAKDLTSQLEASIKLLTVHEELDLLVKSQDVDLLLGRVRYVPTGKGEK